MKRITLLATLSVALLNITAMAHERITIGPRGGRVVYLDSTAIPNVEFVVNKEGRAEIALLDKDRKPIPLTEQDLVLTAGPRSSAKKLKLEKQGDFCVSEPIPAGAPYTVVIQIKEKPDAKSLIARVNYDPTPVPSGKPTYIDDSVNEGSGPSIKIPDTLEGVFGLINQHHGELQENFSEKKYELLDEVTQAFTALLKALPAKSGDKAAAVQPQIDALTGDLAKIAAANANRTLKDAAKALDTFNSGLAALKKNYPATTADAKL